MSHKSGTGCGQGSIVQNKGTADFHLVHNCRESPRNLHGRLDRINGHQKDSKEGGSRRSGHGFDADGQVSGAVHRVEGRQDTGIGRRVTKATKWALQQGW